MSKMTAANRFFLLFGIVILLSRGIDADEQARVVNACLQAEDSCACEDVCSIYREYEANALWRCHCPDCGVITCATYTVLLAAGYTDSVLTEMGCNASWFQPGSSASICINPCDTGVCTRSTNEEEGVNSGDTLLSQVPWWLIGSVALGTVVLSAALIGLALCYQRRQRHLQSHLLLTQGGL
eukprot:TRINITY_DN12978_c0_g1_i1.p1 TRINITY_DN12978_c0_g1~~TRINITY_DN12978_c0_g1_i1.p1  ORF type:complete len:182 (+),score=20.97 TRINITY_DN12978_c0_g1_i1:71-616(+)